MTVRAQCGQGGKRIREHQGRGHVERHGACDGERILRAERRDGIDGARVVEEQHALRAVRECAERFTGEPALERGGIGEIHDRLREPRRETGREFAVRTTGRGRARRNPLAAVLARALRPAPAYDR